MPTAHLGGSLELADHFTLSRMGATNIKLPADAVDELDRIDAR